MDLIHVASEYSYRVHTYLVHIMAGQPTPPYGQPSVQTMQSATQGLKKKVGKLADNWQPPNISQGMMSSAAAGVVGAGAFTVSRRRNTIRDMQTIQVGFVLRRGVVTIIHCLSS